MKPLLIGEQPSRSGDRYHHFPLSGAVAQALCQMAGIPAQPEGTRYGRWTWALYDVFTCVNAVQRHKPWDVYEASAGIAEALADEHEVVVLLGRRVQLAYVAMQDPGDSVLDGLEFFQWVVDPVSPTGRRELVVIPHPSSLNRLYNSDHKRLQAGAALRSAVERAKQMHETRL